MPEERVNHVQVRPADPTRLDANADFAGPRLVELQLLDGEAADLAQDDAAIHDSSSSFAAVPPISASVRSVSAIR